MVLKQKDFIEIEFTGKTKEGEIFDSNIKEDLKKSNLNIKAKPFVFCLGEGMFLKGIEDFLIGKDMGEHTIELEPENAFGKRDSKLIEIIPMKVFNSQKINPYPGAVFNFDGRIAKVLNVSGGRVIVDFNNPMAGKQVIYKLKVIKKINDLNAKVKSLIEFLFRQDLKFSINTKKLIIEADLQMAKFIELFKDKFKDILGLDLEVKAKEVKSNVK
jgi:FKBP-type peptidyl-prolyl cis-trans isomerase SlyD